MQCASTGQIWIMRLYVPVGSLQKKVPMTSSRLLSLCFFCLFVIHLISFTCPPSAFSSSCVLVSARSSFSACFVFYFSLDVLRFTSACLLCFADIFSFYIKASSFFLKKSLPALNLLKQQKRWSSGPTDIFSIERRDSFSVCFASEFQSLGWNCRKEGKNQHKRQAVFLDTLRLTLAYHGGDRLVNVKPLPPHQQSLYTPIIFHFIL